jgi:hypothetical protein
VPLGTQEIRRWRSLERNWLICPLPAGYHCVTRCVRRAFLLGEGDHNRKEWLQNRLEELAGIFAVAVGGFSVMNNHLHLLLRLDPEVARAWSDEEVVRRWGRLFPPRDKSRQPIPVSEHWVQGRLADPKWVANARERLQNLGWFMKCLKEPLSRLANKQDKTRGTFFEGVPDTDAGRCTQGKCRANRGNRAARTAIWAPSNPGCLATPNGGVWQPQRVPGNLLSPMWPPASRRAERSLSSMAAQRWPSVNEAMVRRPRLRFGLVSRAAACDIESDSVDRRAQAAPVNSTVQEHTRHILCILGTPKSTPSMHSMCRVWGTWRFAVHGGRGTSVATISAIPALIGVGSLCSLL